MKIIAELSASHNGDINNALKIIDGVEADIVKLQYWTPDTMAVPHRLRYGQWAGRDLVDLYREAWTREEWLPELFNAITSRGMTPACSVFDREAVDVLEDLDCPIYKIASFEAVDIGLVDYVSRTGKPMIISTGQINISELEKIMSYVNIWCDDVTLLYCVSQYPTDISSVNLSQIKGLRDHFGVPVGFSDHTTSPMASMVAVAMGATMIERHVSLDRKGLDGAFASTVEEFNRTAAMCKDAETMIGDREFTGLESDKSLRRSLYYNQPLKAGTVISLAHLKTARPNHGVCPVDTDRVVGMMVDRDVEINQPVRYTHLRIC